MSAREFRDDDEGYLGSTPTQEIFQFDAIMDVRVRQTSLAVAPSRPAREVQ